jgi:SAM-dependent methyltransferase
MNLQGADNDISKNLYGITFNYIKEGNSVLNFGCGNRFNFEKNLAKIKTVGMTSIDIIEIKEKPEFIGEFLNKSVEEDIWFEKKFDVVTFFELIEHIDKTDVLLRNCFNNLKKEGYLIFSFPNLASFHGRISLLLGLQPCILEVSNESANFGRGFMDRFFSGKGATGKTIHHIRGITHRAMKDMVEYHGFNIEKIIGFDHRFKKLSYYFPGIAPVNVFICRKK